MRRLDAMFGAAFGEPEAYNVNPPDDAWLRRALAKADIVVLAAHDTMSRLADSSPTCSTNANSRVARS